LEDSGGEEPLPSGGACNLGAINLSAFIKHPFTKNAYFDFEDFKETVEIGVEALNEILDEGLPLHPLQEQKDSVAKWRQIGLGIMGFADALIKLGIAYGSKECTDLIEDIGSTMANHALLTSAILAKTQGCFPGCQNNYQALLNSNFIQNVATEDTKSIIEQYGLRNGQLMTIAPTGTLSTMLGISGGMEPLFDIAYLRKTESLHDGPKIYKIYTPIIEQLMEYFGTSSLPSYVVTAHNLNSLKRVDVQSHWQTYIDASISSTINLPKETTVEEIYDIYMYAYNANLKGLTIYRDGCKRVGILTIEKDNLEQEKKEKVGADRGEIIETSEHLIGRKRKLITGCGSLWCLAYFDPSNGELMEVFLSKGSTGGCNNFMTGLSRLISLSARAGVSMDNIFDQLQSCGTCSSYAVRKAKTGDTSKGACCPSAVGYGLKDMYKALQKELVNGGLQRLIPDEILEATNQGPQCPDCNLSMAIIEGCVTCMNCGWSKCS